MSLWASVALADKDIRVALVIGNSAYVNAEQLKNPVNDARAMAKALGNAGFEVIERENVTRRGLIEALHEFAGKVPPGGVGLFYYAGHGLQVRGANYLVPVDAALANEYDVKYETVDVNDVLGRLDEARARLSLVILDACRDDPFTRRFRSMGRGLAQTDAPRGTVIAYATAPGDTAADGDGENGLYTAELLKAIAEPGLKLEEVFKHTIDGVARASGNKQTPWVSSSFRGDFVFNAAAAPPAPATTAPTAAAPPSAPAPATAPPRETLEQTAWASIATSTNPEMFELFLKRFPDGVYADFARARLRELQAAAAAEEKRRSTAPDRTKPMAAPAPAPVTAVAPTPAPAPAPTPAPPPVVSRPLPSGSFTARWTADPWLNLPTYHGAIPVTMSAGVFSGSVNLALGPVTLSGALRSDGSATAVLNTILPAGPHKGEPSTTALTGHLQGNVLALSGVSSAGRSQHIAITLPR